MSVVNDLEAALLAMQNGKPPGVSGSKINFITELSVNHVQSESVIIQKLYTHFKKCPGTHKLGPLYVVDSIARRYLDHAKKHHQVVSAAAPDGTFAAGLYRITNLLPMLMNDILRHTPPEENKDKIEKLFTIWERSSTFPPEVLADVKGKMNESLLFQSQNQIRSTTPATSPPRYLQHVQAAPQSVSSPQIFRSQLPTSQQPTSPGVSPNENIIASMLERLTSMAKASQSAASSAPPTSQQDRPAVTSSTPYFKNPHSQSKGVPGASLSSQFGSLPGVTSPKSLPSSLPYASTPPNANPTPALQPFLNTGYTISQPTQGSQAAQAAFFQNPAPQQPALAPQVPASQIGVEQLALLQLLLQNPALASNMGGFEQLGPALGALVAAQQGGQTVNPAIMQPWQSQTTQALQEPIREGYTDPRGQHSREQRYSPPPRSPPRYSTGERRRGRSRSRSPDRFGQRPSPPTFRRRSPVYGEYDQGEIRGVAQGERIRGGKSRGRRSGGSPRRRDRSRGSPKRFNRPASQAGSDGAAQSKSFPQFPKNVTYDESIAPNRVRDDESLRILFAQYGVVQSCIVNHEKRHAFIKMLTREDAVKAKAGMETYRSDNMTLRTRWGVGFGPRDCSDYQTGVSVIPIERLTEADQRWMVSAEYGGTGGKPLVGGMCVEEPDIEIGQGVSSKAISKRFPTDTALKGPRSSHDHSGPLYMAGGSKRKDRDHSKSADASFNGRTVGQGTPGGRDNDGVAPPTPGFGMGFPFTMPMMPPNMPPGFQYPGYPGIGR